MDELILNLKKKTVINIQVLCTPTLTICLELEIQESANCVVHILENFMFIFLKRSIQKSKYIAFQKCKQYERIQIKIKG